MTAIIPQKLVRYVTPDGSLTQEGILLLLSFQQQTATNAGNITTNTADISTNAAGIAAIPALNIVQVSNTDTATNVNTAASTAIPINGATDFLDASAFVLSGSGIQCLTAGRVWLSASVHITSAVADSSLQLQFAKNGALFGPKGDTGYISTTAGHDNASTHLSTWATAAVNDVFTIDGIASAAAGTSTMSGVGSSLLVGEMFV